MKKDFEILETVKQRVSRTVLKHLGGQHNQKLHGNRGAPMVSDVYRSAYSFYSQKAKSGDSDYLIESYRQLKDARKQDANEPKAYASWGIALPKSAERSLTNVSNTTTSIRALKDVARKNKINLDSYTKSDKMNIDASISSLRNRKMDLESSKRNYETISGIKNQTGMRNVVNSSRQRYLDNQKLYKRQLDALLAYAKSVNYPLKKGDYE